MDRLVFSHNGCLAKISEFQAIHGITTNKFGDCGYNNNLEKEQNLRLMKLNNASCFFKIIPEHKDKIKAIKPGEKICNWLECDSLICVRPQKQKPILISNTADCPIIFIVERHHKLISLVHSGWRGTALNIVAKTIEKIKICFEIKPTDLKVGVWGGICINCYKVSNELKRYFPGKINNGHLDLREIIFGQLIKAQIPIENIFLPNNAYCSAHSWDTNGFLFASFRRDQNEFRNAAFITF
jgi:copper oxidase (laccase) domain-containing protein